MTKIDLDQFANAIFQDRRISFGDVQRLQRDILPNGVTSREDAALLLDLDRKALKVDAGWTRWLVAAMVDFVVWAERPTGVVKEETARWLASALAGAESAKTARLIVREIAREADAFEKDTLAVLATLGRSRPGRAVRTPAPVALAA